MIPEAVDLSLNARVLGFTLAAGVGSGLLFGLAPVLQALRPNTTAALRDRGTVASGARVTWLRGAFVILQIAISLVLLVGAGLFLRTLENAYSVDLGYQVENTLVASLNLDARGYFEGGSRGAEAGAAVYEQVLSRVESLPGVVAAAAARMTVLSGGARSTAVSTDGRPIEPDNSNALGVRANVVSRRYFETMGIQVLRGRAFDASDGPHTTPVAIVTKSLADRLWPNDDPIGKTLRGESAQLQVIVGVVPDTVYTSTVERERPPAYYLLLAQNYESAVALHVRAAGNPLSLIPAIRDAVRQVDGQLPVEQPQLLGAVLDRTLGRQRMMATLVGLFGVVALMLAVIGLYGVMAHAATERTPEIGIRLAMGAQPGIDCPTADGAGPAIARDWSGVRSGRCALRHAVHRGAALWRDGDRSADVRQWMPGARRCRSRRVRDSCPPLDARRSGHRSSAELICPSHECCHGVATMATMPHDGSEGCSFVLIESSWAS